MTTLLPWLFGFLFLCAGGTAYYFYRELLKESQKYVRAEHQAAVAATDHTREVQGLRGQVQALQTQYQSTEAELSDTKVKLSNTSAELRLRHDDVADLMADIERIKVTRPELRRESYSIVTVGMPRCGKTALTKKWANPLVRIESMTPTKFAKYERTVSRQNLKSGMAVEHVFEIRDWAGEFIVDAQAELVTLESVHGLLIVVDLGVPKRDNQLGLDEERIKAQIEEFRPNALRFFFGDKLLSHCKTVALFINKSDCVSGTPGEVERRALEIYRPLIDALNKFKEDGKVDVIVMVGSATSGHNTHNLFAHFIEKILPADAYDQQLLHGTETPPPPAADNHAAGGRGGRRA